MEIGNAVCGHLVVEVASVVVESLELFCAGGEVAWPRLVDLSEDGQERTWLWNRQMGILLGAQCQSPGLTLGAENVEHKPVF